MRSLLLFFVAGCAAPAPGPDASVVVPPRVRVATFNTHLFFDTVCESGACGPLDFEQQATDTGFDGRATELADAIRTLDADVVALQELETQPCLDALVARLGAVHATLGEVGFAGSVDVAVISKRPLELVRKHRADEPLVRPDGGVTTFSRELLEVHTRGEYGTKVIVVAAHFRSKNNDDPDRRLAEARVSRLVLERIAAAEPTALVVLAGDLNDTPGSPPLDALTLDGGLLRAAADLPEASQWTYVFNGVGLALDHLLQARNAGPPLAPYSARTWRTGRGWGGSDHSALTAEWSW